jgi:nucleoid-associated protein YgaU
MAKILEVPYRSQWDQDANKSNTDCGPACLAMLLGYYGNEASINELFRATGVAPGRYVSFSQMQRVARSFGVTFEYGANCTLDDLKRWIDEGKPAIALVKYSYWSQIEPGQSTQDTFSGPHFVVVVGYGEGNIYINDPNYWAPRRNEGHVKAWSEVLFSLAWSNVRTPSMPNPNNSAIVPTVGKATEAEPGSETDTTENVIEYTVQIGDTWTGLAGRFYNDQTRYPEILAFNNLQEGSPLHVGQKLIIPLPEAGDAASTLEEPIVLGEGAVQIIHTDLVKILRKRWIDAGKVADTADEVTVLREFLSEKGLWETGNMVPEPVVDVEEIVMVEYTVQPGDSWAGIAGRFLGDQMRFPEILEFNGLHPDAPLQVGLTIRIPPH